MSKKARQTLCNLVFGFAAIATMFAMSTIIYAALWHSRGQNAVFLGQTIPWTANTKYTLGMVILVSIVLMLITYVSGVISASYCLRMAIIIIITMAADFAVVRSTINDAGVGTIQASLDVEEVHQSDFAVEGELGVYGGCFEMVESEDDPDGIALACETGVYAICRKIDAYGPFSYPMLNDRDDMKFSEGAEVFASIPDESGLLRSVTMREYHDGYWLIVKRFAYADDLRVEINHLEDLRKYIAQAEYTVHRDLVDSEDQSAAIQSELEYFTSPQ